MSDLENRLRAALEHETIEVSARPSLADDMVQRGTTVRRRRRIAGGVAGLAMLAAIVPAWRSIDTTSGSGGPIQQPTVTVPSTPNTTPTNTTPTNTTPTNTTPNSGPSGLLPEWTRSQVHVAHTPAVPPHVTDVRVGPHGSYDRVVIDFDGAIPGYTVHRVYQLVEDASGATIHVPGAMLLAVTMTPADAHTASGVSTFNHPHRQIFDDPALRAVVFTGDFDGVVGVGIGLRDVTSFRVFELPDPNRLVIDVRHG